MKKKIIQVLIILIGVALLVYPWIANYLNEHAAKSTISTYENEVKHTDKKEREEMLEKAREYNESLVGKVNRYYLNEEEKKRYAHILDITKTGIMAYVEIPKLNIYMPVYHGTDEGVLQIAAVPCL